jgi:hypothetical protein
MSKFAARLLPYSLLFAGLFLAGAIDTTSAQIPSPGKVAAPTNSLTVKRVKRTVAAPPARSRGLPRLVRFVFPVNVVCTPFGPSASVTLTAANPSRVIRNIPVGSTCNVVEPPFASACRSWLGSVAAPPTNVPGQSVTILPPPAAPSLEVSNVFLCPPGLTGFTGSLRVTKTIVDDRGVRREIRPDMIFRVSVECDNNGPYTGVTLTAAAPSGTVPYIMLNTNCTIMESEPTLPPDCSLGPVSYPNGQSAFILTPDQTIDLSVQNTIYCERARPVPDTSFRVRPSPRRKTLFFLRE